MRRLLVAVLVCGVLCACDNEGIHAYRAPKAVAKGATGAPAAAPASQTGVTWKAPATWQTAASDQQVRLATFKTSTGPEVTVTSFPGDVGGLLANVNRWRGQVGLGPIAEADLANESQNGEVQGVKFTTVDLAGTNAQRLVGAVIVPGDGKTWFVKAMGQSDAIGKLKPEFAEFVRSFRFEGGSPSSEAAPATAAKPSQDTIADRLAAWKLPENWKPDPKASSMVAAAYDATNAQGAAKITATVLVNDGGGVLANINRWRDQLALPPVERLDQQPITDLGGGNLVVDIASADGARRMMAAIVQSDGGTWFFKISGSPNAVAAEAASFDRLVRGVGLGEQPR